MQKSQQFSKHILPNGLTVVLAPMEGVKSVTTLVLVSVGSRYETPKLAGISHFLEHMVFKQTAKFKNTQELSIALDAVGAEHNAFTSKEYTGYYVKSASKHIQLGLDVVSDLVLTPTFPAEELEKEKGVIVEEIHMYQDTPRMHIGDVFEDVVFAGSSLGRDVIGFEKTVKSFTRQDFVEYIRQWYGPKNMALILAGDAEVLNSKTLMPMVEKMFSKGAGAHKNGGDRKHGDGVLYAPNNKIQTFYKKTEQAHFMMGFPAFDRNDDDRYALSVLSALFGKNMSSRLFVEVREKRGLCYYVRSGVEEYHDRGVFAAAAGVDPKRIEEAVKVVRGEFEHLLDAKGARAITDVEINRAKDFLTGATILDMEDSMSVAMFYAEKQVLEGKLQTVDDELKIINAVTKDDVMRVGKRLLNETSPYFAVIGPYRDTLRFSELVLNK